MATLIPLLISLFLLLDSLATISIAYAEITVFSDEATFLAATAIASTETFDEFPSNTNFGSGTVIIDGITYTAGNNALWQTDSGGTAPVSPPNKFGINAIETNTLTFGPGFVTNAIGFYVLYAGTTDPSAQSQITVTSALGTSVTEVLSFPFGGQPVAFRGFAAPEGIISVEVANIPNPQVGFSFAFDNVSRGDIRLAVVTAVLDIRSGGPNNNINPNSNAVIPVAILSTDSFDVGTVDQASLRFGPGLALAEGNGHLEDVNGDGQPDLVLRFRVRESGIQCGDTSVSITGETLNGIPIQGTDAIRTVGCKRTGG